MPSLELDAETSAIWHLLLDAGKATEEQLTEVFEEHERTGRPFTTVVYNYEIVEEDELLQLIADDLGTEVVEIDQEELDEEMLEQVSNEVARMYGVIPIGEEYNTLSLAARDPMNYRMIDELNFVLEKDCRVFVGRPGEIDDALDKFYPERADSVKDVLAEMAQDDSEIHDIDADIDDEESLEEAAANAPIIKFVNVILYQAVKDQASDVHFEPFVDEFRIRYRIDGALYEMAPPPRHLAIPVISRLKVLAGLNIAEHRHPQDGRIEIRIAGRTIDLRVSTLPTQYGESVVLRVLDRTVVELDLGRLGMSQTVLKEVRETVHTPNGIFIVTGPTGCGKTTTLYSALKEINLVEDKLLTAEDPVEYDLEGIMQVHIRERVGLTFAASLRSFLRQDPDRIMVGEVRDLETAQMAVQAALTGHLVLSTLHTNDAPGAITRLIDMGLEPFLITSTLRGILAQRLIRRICNVCKTEYEPEDRELEQLGLTREEVAEKTFYYGKGCENCSNTGYKGRVGIFEYLQITPEIQKLINTRKPTGEIRELAVEQGMELMRLSGVRTILDGLSTAEEVLKYT